jgi:hypothetical protein
MTKADIVEKMAKDASISKAAAERRQGNPGRLWNFLKGAS